jgi:hypothetical protein
MAQLLFRFEETRIREDRPADVERGKNDRTLRERLVFVKQRIGVDL